MKNDMICPNCQSSRIRKTGFTPKTRHQRYRCNDCNTTWSDGVKGSEPIGDRPMTDAEKMREYRRRKQIDKLIDES